MEPLKADRKIIVWILWGVTVGLSLVLCRVGDLATHLTMVHLDQLRFTEVPRLTELVFYFSGWLWLEVVLGAVATGWVILRHERITGVIWILCQTSFFVLLCALVAVGLLVPYLPLQSGSMR